MERAAKTLGRGRVKIPRRIHRRDVCTAGILSDSRRVRSRVVRLLRGSFHIVAGMIHHLQDSEVEGFIEIAQQPRQPGQVQMRQWYIWCASGVGKYKCIALFCTQAERDVFKSLEETSVWIERFKSFTCYFKSPLILLLSWVVRRQSHCGIMFGCQQIVLSLMLLRWKSGNWGTFV